MKRIISAVLLIAVALCSLAVGVSADGTVYFSADFSSDEAFAKDFFPEAFSTDEGEAFGYGDARALQTKLGWHKYDTEFTFCAEEDDGISTNENRTVSFVYINHNLEAQGLADGSISFAACLDFDNDEISLVKDGFSRGDSTEDLVTPVSFDFKDGKYYTFGVSVTQGRIRVFHEGSLVIDYVDSANEHCIGYEYAEEPSILLWWNTANYVRFSDIKVSSPEYLYPMAAASVTPVETTTSHKVVEVTDKDGNTVTDDKGNAVTSVSVVTQAPGAANTNQGGNVNGSSSTGDVAFVVVAVMVATLGCALVVRKVSAR